MASIKREEITFQSASDIRCVVERWLVGKISSVDLGLPEYDDRLEQWRVALLAQHNGREAIGEVRVDGTEVVFSTDLRIAEKRSKHVPADKKPKKRSIEFAPVSSRVILGDSSVVLEDYPPDSVQLVFTSPPYFNAKPEYYESEGYAGYLETLRDIFEKCHSVLAEGRFLVVNTSPVLIRRANRQVASRRLPITYDLHPILDKIGFEFVDDIIWQKPEGAGWHLGRGRRFAADRQPLQYKPVTVTENIVVYRKKTPRLIDWNIRNHPYQEAVLESLIDDGYERTNIWKIHPAHHKEHPAVFPNALAQRVIEYYSFVGDMVLDPFAGIGTTGIVAGKTGRRFFLIEKDERYFNIMRREASIKMHEPHISDFEYFASTW